MKIIIDIIIACVVVGFFTNQLNHVAVVQLDALFLWDSVVVDEDAIGGVVGDDGPLAHERDAAVHAADEGRVDGHVDRGRNSAGRRGGGGDGSGAPNVEFWRHVAIAALLVVAVVEEADAVAFVEGKQSAPRRKHPIVVIAVVVVE